MTGIQLSVKSSCVPVPGRLIRYARFLSVAVLVLLLNALTSGCSAPVRAPVVSRDQPPTHDRSARPSRYRIQKGDTLYSIAWRFGVDYTSIARWNGIRYPYTIYPGQRIRLAPPSRVRVGRAPVAKYPQKKRAILPAKSVQSKKRVSRSANKGVLLNKTQGKNTDVALKLEWLWPTNGAVAEGFVKGDPIRKGVKIAGRHGAAVTAAESGKVVYAGSGLIGYGRLVIIKHNKNYLSAYGYNRKILVKEGDTVKKGIRIAEMGSDGSGKPMLHFEIRRNGTPVDPMRLLPRHP